MKNPLFGIDVQMHEGNNTEVVFWRSDLKRPDYATRKTIRVTTTASRNRLSRLLPPPNSSMSIWPSEDYLSIDFILYGEAK